MKKYFKCLILTFIILILCSCSSSNINVRIYENNKIDVIVNYEIMNQDHEYYKDVLTNFENKLNSCEIIINTNQNEYFTDYEILLSFDNIEELQAKLNICEIDSIKVKEKKSLFDIKYIFDINIKPNDNLLYELIELNKTNPDILSRYKSVGELTIKSAQAFETNNAMYENSDKTEIGWDLEDIINNKEKFSYTVHNYNTIYILSGTIFALVVIIIIILFIKISIKKKKAYKKRDLREININLE